MSAVTQVDDLCHAWNRAEIVASIESGFVVPDIRPVQKVLSMLVDKTLAAGRGVLIAVEAACVLAVPRTAPAIVCDVRVVVFLHENCLPGR